MEENKKRFVYDLTDEELFNLSEQELKDYIIKIKGILTRAYGMQNFKNDLSEFSESVQRKK